MRDLNFLTIAQALEGLKAKKFSCFELTQACLERIKKTEPELNAFITVCEKDALAEAKKADLKIKTSKNLKALFNKWPLLGIPMAIKDNFSTKSIKTTAASRVLKNYVPVYDATVVKKLINAGSIILGKTNLDAWAHGSSTETSFYGSTKNPWDLNRLPGGSSGGSAVAIAAHQTIGAIGSETAGSIRQPAAWSGVTGLKPTYGRVSRYGLIAMASSTDSPGPMTKDVQDAALVLKVLAGVDRKDATTSPLKPLDYLKNLQKSIKGLRLGLPEEYFFKQIDPEVSKMVNKAIGIFEKLGAKTRNLNLLDPRYSVAVYTVVQRSEVSSNLARFDGIRFGQNRNFFGKEAKRRIMLGTHTLSSGYFDQYYHQAQKVRTLILKDFKKAFDKIDLIAAPTSPCLALKSGATENEPLFGEKQDILMAASSLAGLPGINLPCGFSRNNLPVGLQIIGPQFSEALLLQAGFAYQQVTDWHQRRPKL